MLRQQSPIKGKSPQIERSALVENIVLSFKISKDKPSFHPSTKTTNQYKVILRLYVNQGIYTKLDKGKIVWDFVCNDLLFSPLKGCITYLQKYLHNPNIHLSFAPLDKLQLID